MQLHAANRGGDRTPTHGAVRPQPQVLQAGSFDKTAALAVGLMALLGLTPETTRGGAVVTRTVKMGVHPLCTCMHACSLSVLHDVLVQVALHVGRAAAPVPSYPCGRESFNSHAYVRPRTLQIVGGGYRLVTDGIQCCQAVAGWWLGGSQAVASLFIGSILPFQCTVFLGDWGGPAPQLGT